MEHSKNHSLGFIKLYRSVMDKAWYKKPGYFQVWAHLLLSASHSGYETWFNGQVIVLKPGQLVVGRKKISETTGIGESKVQRILKFFANERQIEQITTSTCRLITITNWDVYNQNEQRNERPVNSLRTTDEQPVNTIQEGKEGYKKEKNVKKSTGKSIAWLKENKAEAISVIEERFPKKDAEAAYKYFLNTVGAKQYGYSDHLQALCNWIEEDKFGKFPAKKYIPTERDYY